MSAKMTYEYNYFDEEIFTFKKYPGNGTVNIYNGSGVEVDMFTNYEIGSDFDKFEESCKEYIAENFND